MSGDNIGIRRFRTDSDVKVSFQLWSEVKDGNPVSSSQPYHRKMIRSPTRTFAFLRLLDSNPNEFPIWKDAQMTYSEHIRWRNQGRYQLRDFRLDRGGDSEVGKDGGLSPVRTATIHPSGSRVKRSHPAEGVDPLLNKNIAALIIS